MTVVARSSFEEQRLDALRELGVLETGSEERFDRVTQLAVRLFDVPISLVTLVDAETQWPKSSQGPAPGPVPREHSFCSHAIVADELLVVPDAREDPRFADNPLVCAAPYIRFYAGQPLHGPGGYPLGTLCIADHRPRQPSHDDLLSLSALAAWAETELNSASLGRALADRRRSEARLRAILRSIPEGILVIDDAGRIVNANPAAELIFGRELSELGGCALVELLEAGTLPEPPARQEFTVCRPDGTVLPVDISLTMRAESELGGAVALVADVSERHALDRIQDELVAVVSHELRTPLASIRGYVDYVADGEAGPVTVEQDEALRVVRRGADRLERLVDDLMFVSAAQAGRAVLAREPVQLAAVVRQSVAAARPVAERSDIRLTYERDDAPIVAGDADRLGQVVDNLVANAIKFTPRRGSVEVTVSSSEETAVVEVADTGIGIPEDERGRMFQPFFRTSRAISQAVPGTGLGLYAAKAIVEACGGRLDFESREGAGTTFRITLPLSPGKAPKRPRRWPAATG